MIRNLGTDRLLDVISSRLCLVFFFVSIDGDRRTSKTELISQGTIGHQET